MSMRDEHSRWVLEKPKGSADYHSNISVLYFLLGFANISTKSGSWDQFGSQLAIALICLTEGRRFLQMILEIEPKNTKQYHAFKLTSKMFANMRLNFQGDHMPLLGTMLPPAQAAIAGESSGEAAPSNPQTVPKTILELITSFCSHDLVTSTNVEDETMEVLDLLSSRECNFLVEDVNTQVSILHVTQADGQRVVGKCSEDAMHNVDHSYQGWLRQSAAAFSCSSLVVLQMKSDIPLVPLVPLMSLLVVDVACCCYRELQSLIHQGDLLNDLVPELEQASSIEGIHNTTEAPKCLCYCLNYNNLFAEVPSNALRLHHNTTAPHQVAEKYAICALRYASDADCAFVDVIHRDKTTLVGYMLAAGAWGVDWDRGVCAFKGVMVLLVGLGRMQGKAGGGVVDERRSILFLSTLSSADADHQLESLVNGTGGPLLVTALSCVAILTHMEVAFGVGVQMIVCSSITGRVKVPIVSGGSPAGIHGLFSGWYCGLASRKVTLGVSMAWAKGVTTGTLVRYETSCGRLLGNLLEDKEVRKSGYILAMFSPTRKKSRWGTIFPTGLKHYKEPLVEPKEIG
ncbi:hypothetical protein Tco_0618062 [Tanacetum coccineum]